MVNALGFVLGLISYNYTVISCSGRLVGLSNSNFVRRWENATRNLGIPVVLKG